jgi:Icc-related predicted phosphoesterase
MTLLCIADIHGDGAGLREALDSFPKADLVVLAGDITHLGGFAEAQKVLAPLLESDRRVVAVPGNMDREGVGRFLEERGISIHGRGVSVGDVGFQGLGGSNPSPFGTPFEVGGGEARRLLAEGRAQIEGCALRVLVSHAPPKDTRLDRSFAGMHVGSPEVRSFLLSDGTSLCLCGHIHEAAGEDTVGRTRCVNLGPLKNGSYAVVKISADDISVTWRKK